MMRRLIVSFGLLLCLCLTVMANKEITIKLDGKHRVQSENLGFAYITFEYLYPYGNNAIVRVSVENITIEPPHAVLIFKNDVAEKFLKKGKPKIEFDKIYPGKKGTRAVEGFKEAKQYINIIPASETDTIFMIDVPFTSSKNFTLPLYEAKYKAKDLYKKRKKGTDGEYKIKYKIWERHLYDFHIEVEGWSEADSTYVETKKAVDDFISSLKGVEFCNNKKHTPSIKKQQLPYKEKKDKLLQVIANILDAHSEWMSTDAPHKAYSQLQAMLNKVELNSMATDCGNHKIKPKGHSCSVCSLKSKDIYQRLDDLYQQLYTGKINKDQAVKAARNLYNCYQQNKNRKKDNSYGSKISRFYNSIANY